MLSEKRISQYKGWLGNNTYALTAVFNRNYVSAETGGEALREFHKRIDCDRLGGRFYAKPIGQRSRLLVISEKWDAHPHYHGYLALPEGAEIGVEEIKDRYEQIWRDVFPGGTMQIDALHDFDGWAGYVSKEAYIFDGAIALDSLVDGSKGGWVLPKPR